MIRNTLPPLASNDLFDSANELTTQVEKDPTLGGVDGANSNDADTDLVGTVNDSIRTGGRFQFTQHPTIRRSIELNSCAPFAERTLVTAARIRFLDVSYPHSKFSVI